VVFVAGHAVRAERDDRVRPDRPDDAGEVRHDHLVRRGGAGAVGDPQQVVFGNAQRGERGVPLAFAHPRHPGRWPAGGVIGAVLTERGRDAHHPLARVAGRGHQARGQERLVVGVGPDTEHGAELGDRADGRGPGVLAKAGGHVKLREHGPSNIRVCRLCGSGMARGDPADLCGVAGQ
jgi:hypothetical protein